VLPFFVGVVGVVRVVVFLVVVGVVVVFLTTVVVLFVWFVVVLLTVGNALSVTVIDGNEELFAGTLITYTPYPVPTKNAATMKINKYILPLDIPELFG
jgi:hypothetical protein